MQKVFGKKWQKIQKKEKAFPFVPKNPPRLHSRSRAPWGGASLPQEEITIHTMQRGVTLLARRAGRRVGNSCSIPAGSGEP